MGAVVKSIGPQSTPYFEALLPLLPSCFDPADFFLMRQTFIAVLGFLTTALGDSMVSYLQLLLPIVQQGMVDELAETRRVTALLITALCRACGEAALPFYPTFLQVLRSKERCVGKEG